MRRKDREDISNSINPRAGGTIRWFDKLGFGRGWYYDACRPCDIFWAYNGINGDYIAI